MVKSAGRILKASDVELVEGQLTLSIVQPQPKQPGTTLAEPQVRIVESQPDFAVIEITCSCGTGMNLKCEYAHTKTSKAMEVGQAQQQNSASESTNNEAQQT